jgi:hypothetical protein
MEKATLILKLEVPVELGPEPPRREIVLEFLDPGLPELPPEVKGCLFLRIGWIN